MTCSRNGGDEKYMQNVKEPEGKRLLGRSRRRYDNIKVALKEV